MQYLQGVERVVTDYMFVETDAVQPIPAAYNNIIDDFCVEVGQKVEIIAIFSGTGNVNAMQILKDGA